jgi:UDPglucose 6-dehydrogenase
MQIAMIGTGYVGLVSGACFADFGHAVTCVDRDAARIVGLQQSRMPFFEPGLAEIVERNTAAGRLSFTTDIAAAVANATVIFLAVGTPEGANGEADLGALMGAAREIAQHATGYRLVVTKSTVPAGTGASVRDVFATVAAGRADLDVASNPEFLREGSAIEDFMRPDRVVVGVSSERAKQLLQEIYRPLYLIETPFLVTDVETAEMIKYAANAFLATKISFINEIANLCEQVGADAHVVAKGMGLDRRIGPKFLHPGPGFGGSCFPKDTRGLAALGQRVGVRQRIVETVIDVNDRQLDRAMEKLHATLGAVAGAEVAVLGLSFKPRTSDVREAPALHLIRGLAAAGARVRAFDPVAARDAAEALGGDGAAVRFADSTADAVAGADAVVIMTEWNEFRSLDLAALKPVMRRPIVIDMRNVLDPRRAHQAGFVYVGTGRAVKEEMACR